LIDLRELVSGLPRAEREPNEIDNQSAKLNKLRGLTVQEIQMLQRLQKLSEEIRQLQDSCNAVRRPRLRFYLLNVLLTSINQSINQSIIGHDHSVSTSEIG